MGGIKSSATLDLDYPIYAAKFINNKTVLIAGGGGEGNNGIPNKITAVKCFFKATDKSKVLQKFREITLPKNEDSPMCLDIAKNGSKDDSYTIFVGCNQSTQLIQSMNINNSLRKYTYSKDEHLRFVDAAQLEPLESIDDDTSTKTGIATGTTGGAAPADYPKVVYLSSNNSIGCFMTSKVPSSIYIFEPDALDTKFVFTPKDEALEIKDFHISPDDDGKTICYITSKSVETISTITSNPISSSLASQKANTILSKYILSKVRYVDNSHVLITATARGAVGAKQGVTLFLYRLTDQTIVRQKLISTKIKGITGIDVCPLQDLIALAGNDTSLTILRLSDFKSLQVFKKLHAFAITRLAFSPNGTALASVSAANSLNVMKFPPNFARKKSTIGTLFSYLLTIIIIALLSVGLQKSYENGQLVKGVELLKEYGLKGVQLANEYTKLGISYIKEKLKDEDQTNSEDSSTYFKIEPEDLKKLTISSDEYNIETTEIDPELYSLTLATWAATALETEIHSSVEESTAPAKEEETASSVAEEPSLSSTPLQEEEVILSVVEEEPVLSSVSEETSSKGDSIVQSDISSEISTENEQISESTTFSSAASSSSLIVSSTPIAVSSLTSGDVEAGEDYAEEIEEIEYIEVGEDHEYDEEVIEEVVVEGEGEGDDEEIVIIEIEEIEGEDEEDQAFDAPSTVEEIEVQQPVELNIPVVETELTEESVVADPEPIIAVDDLIEDETIVKFITHTVTLDESSESILAESAPPVVEEILVEPVVSAAETLAEEIPVVESLSDGAPTVVQEILEQSSIAEKVVSERAPVVEEIVEHAKSIVENIEHAAPVVEDTIEEATPAAESIIQQATAVVESVVEEAAPVVESFVEQAAPVVESFVEQASSTVHSVVEQTEALTEAVEAIPSAVEELVSPDPIETDVLHEAQEVLQDSSVEEVPPAQPVVAEIVEQIVPEDEGTLPSSETGIPEPSPAPVPVDEPELVLESIVEEVISHVSEEPSSAHAAKPSKSKIIRTKTKRIVKKVKRTKAPVAPAHDEL